MRTRFLMILTIGFCLAGSAVVHGQPGRREPHTGRPNIVDANRKSGKSRQPIKGPKVKVAETANVVINASPADAVLLMNGQQVEGAALAGLKPGAYVLTARRVGYTEESRSITLLAGENVPITITLVSLRGTLGVTPNVSGAEITVKKVESDNSQETRTFANNVVDLNLPPGEYEISISKEGYRGVKRTITLHTAGSVYLEPQLSKLPPENKPTQPAAMSMQTSLVGKYFLVSLFGSSQNTAHSGMLDVVVDETAESSSRVSGLLPGFPCRVELLVIDNVSDYSFTERPEAANDWKRVAVKVRPKNNSRPSVFTIVWVSLAAEDGSTGKAQETAVSAANSQFEPVTVRKRVLPTYPASARSARTSGVVVVIVEINEKGKVVSAKATEGPIVLRQSAENAARQWEFNPAKNNGVALPSSQRLVFKFEP